MPDSMPSTLPTVGSPVASAPMAEPEIHVIPDAFYGAALKARVEEPKKPSDAPVPDGKNKRTPLIIGGVVFVLAMMSVGAYLNRNALFPQPAAPVAVVQPVVPPPPPPSPPEAPSNLSATSTNPQSVALQWTNVAANEDGLRVERAEANGSFVPLTNVAARSASFLDTSVQPNQSYRYRIIAVNAGGESAPSVEASAATSPLPPPPPEAPKLPPAGLDTDSDGLTDLEEALYGTNARDPDTDKDRFLDGNEAFNLFDPTTPAPARLVDSNVVKPFIGTIGWTMLVPSAWTATLDATDGASANITTGHGETFRLSVVDNPAGQTVLDWYLANHPEVKPEQVLEYRSKKGYVGIIGADLLTTYIPWGDKFFVFTYDIDGQPFINFRTTYSMMLNALMLKGVPQITAPVGTAPLPFEPAATTTGIIAQPKSVVEPATTTPEVPLPPPTPSP